MYTYTNMYTGKETESYNNNTIIIQKVSIFIFLNEVKDRRKNKMKQIGKIIKPTSFNCHITLIKEKSFRQLERKRKDRTFLYSDIAGYNDALLNICLKINI